MGMRRIPRKRNPFDIGSPSADTTSITVGAESSNVIAVTVQLKDARGVNPTAIKPVRVWLSGSATTGAIIATGPTTVAATTGSVLAVITAVKMVDCITNATGALVLDITLSSGAATYYLYVQMPDGTVKISGVITFAA